MRKIALLIAMGTLFSSLGFAQESEVVYSFGEEKIYSPNGNVYWGSRTLLAKTIYDQKASTITEEVLSVDPQRGKENFRVDFEINGSQFTCKDAAQTFTCVGDLQGPEWKWTGWQFKVTLNNNQGYLEVTEQFFADGYTGEKMFFTPDGQKFSYSVVSMNKVSLEEYGRLYEELANQTLDAERTPIFRGGIHFSLSCEK